MWDSTNINKLIEWLIAITLKFYKRKRLIDFRTVRAYSSRPIILKITKNWKGYWDHKIKTGISNNQKRFGDKTKIKKRCNKKIEKQLIKYGKF